MLRSRHVPLLWAIVSCAALAACGGPTSYSPPATASNAASTARTLAQSVRADVRFGLSPNALALAQAHRGPGWWAHPDKNESTVFVSDLNGAQIRIFPAKVKNPTQTGSITTGIDLPINVAADRKGTLYVANNGNSTVTEYPFGQTSPSVTLSGNGLVNPNGIAVDRKGTVYVTSGSTVGQCYVLEYPAGSTTPSKEVDGLGLPIGLAVDVAGNLFIADAQFGSNKVWMVPAGSTQPRNLNLSGLNDDTGVALSPKVDLYVSNYNSNAVNAYHIGDTTPFATISSGLNQPYALGFTKNFRLFVGNYSGTISAYKGSQTMPFETFSGGVSPTGVALYPPVKAGP